MKKISILLLAVLALFAITACDNSTEEPKDTVVQLSTTELEVPVWAEGVYNDSSEQLTLTIKDGKFSIEVPGIGSVDETKINMPCTEQKEITKADGTKQYVLTAKFNIIMPATEDNVLTVTQLDDRTLAVSLPPLLNDPLTFTEISSAEVAAE